MFGRLSDDVLGDSLTLVVSDCPSETHGREPARGDSSVGASERWIPNKLPRLELALPPEIWEEPSELDELSEVVDGRAPRNGAPEPKSYIPSPDALR